MHAIRLHTVADADRELHLPDVPVRKGQRLEVIILAEDDADDEDDFMRSVLNHDPAWAWLKDDAEDIYTDDDLEERYR